MRYADADAAFRQYLEASGLTVEDLDAPSAVAAMLGFYAAERAADVDMDTDGDMILFQWGIYDWGSGPTFEYGIVRQFFDEDDDDDEGEGIWQLRLTVHFPPDEENARLRSGDRWLERPAGLGEFTGGSPGSRLPHTAPAAVRSAPNSIGARYNATVPAAWSTQISSPGNEYPYSGAGRPPGAG